MHQDIASSDQEIWGKATTAQSTKHRLLHQEADRGPDQELERSDEVSP